MPSSIFEKIAQRKLPAHIIWEDENHLAFLDISPLNPGHTLVIPKLNPGDHLFDLPHQDYLALLTAAKTVANLLTAKLKVPRILMAVEGLEVPHVHIKLIPSTNQELSSLTPHQASTQELQAVQAKILGLT